MGAAAFELTGQGDCDPERRLRHGSAHWQSLLDGIMAQLDATAAAIVSYQGRLDGPGPAWQTLICQRGRERLRSANGMAAPGGAPFRGSGDGGAERLRLIAGRVFGCPLSRPGLDHRLIAVLAAEEDHATVIELERSAERPPFGPLEIAVLERLLPGLQLAIRCLLRSPPADLQARVFNRLPVAVAQVGASREILFHNHAWEDLLAKADGLRIVSDRVWADAEGDDLALEDRIRRASSGIRPLAFLRIGRPSGRPHYLMHIEPFRYRAPRFDAGAGTAVLVVLSPADCDRRVIGRFGAAYGLTEAEIGVVRALLEGQAVHGAAENLHLRPDTVRWHLKRIFAKTKTASQADLIRLFMHGMHLRIT